MEKITKNSFTTGNNIAANYGEDGERIPCPSWLHYHINSSNTVWFPRLGTIMSSFINSVLNYVYGFHCALKNGFSLDLILLKFTTI